MGNRAAYNNRLFLVLSIMLPAVLTLLLIAGTFFFLFIPALETDLLQARREMTRETCNIGYNLISEYYQRYQNGSLAEQEAQERALARLEALRFGPEGKDYFWVNTVEGGMAMHPYRKDLVGTDMLNWEDPTGKQFIRDFIWVVRNQGEGFVDYQWQWKDDSTRIVPKISYVKGFEPWGWIIGTGMYIEDIHQRIANTTQRLARVFVLIFMLIVLLSIVIILNGLRIDKHRQLSEQALRASEEKFRSLFETMTEGVYIRSIDGELVESNPAFQKTLGIEGEDLSSFNISQFYSDPEEYKRFTTEVEANGIVSNYPMKVIRRDGTPLHVLVTAILRNDDEGNPTQVQGVVRDVTETKELEERLNQSQKMEAVGRLAGGIAHDFNNLLTVIIGQSELMLLEKEKIGEDTTHVDDVLKSAYRATELVGQLLAFSRHQVIVPVPMRINESLRHLSKLLHRTLGEDITLRLNLQDEVPCILADPPQLDQVILNLCINSRDAMPSGGELNVRTYLIPPDGKKNIIDGILYDSGVVVLEIEDSGIGIDEETLPHIFEPFYTTKLEKGGSGLGLSTVYGIVRKLNGQITVQSTPGEGTRFTLRFPAILSKETKTSDIHSQEGVENGGTESILVVEDDRNVRSITIRILRQFGYTVHAVEDPVKALDLVKKLPEPVDLLLTDMIMPGMNGFELMHKLRAIWPTTRLMMMSAYTPQQDGGGKEENLTFGYLQKPFGPAALTRKVREILDTSLESSGKQKTSGA
ncbi:cache domain-containing protein [bacterium]|nr:cache domain-containing protein [bacterium]